MQIQMQKNFVDVYWLTYNIKYDIIKLMKHKENFTCLYIILQA